MYSTKQPNQIVMQQYPVQQTYHVKTSAPVGFRISIVVNSFAFIQK